MFKKMFGIDVIEYATGSDIKIPEQNKWKEDFIGQIQKRVTYIENLRSREKLPEETIKAFIKIIEALKA